MNDFLSTIVMWVCNSFWGNLLCGTPNVLFVLWYWVGCVLEVNVHIIQPFSFHHAHSNWRTWLNSFEFECICDVLLTPQGVGPQWLLYNLAGLYWRVHGNLYNGIECLRRAVATTPEEWRDVPLVNLAALLYTAGHIDDALTLTLQAMSVADHEVKWILDCCWRKTKP